MGFRILYITNYYLEDVTAQRHCANFISQAGQNKGSYIMELLRAGGNEVTVWSNAWTSSTSLRYYKGFQSKIDGQIYYSDILGAPFFNYMTCRRSAIRFLKEQQRKTPFDFIVFYNMRPENVPVALYAKKHYHIPIVLQYEDGLTMDEHVGAGKRLFYKRLENRALPKLDGAILVTSKLQVACPSVVIRGVMRNHPGEQTECPAERDDIPNIFFASTLDKQRGIEVLLSALEHTKEQFTLTITGRGALEQRVRACRDPRVRFLGYLKYEEYQRALAEADICVNAQLAKGGFGNASFPSKLYEYLSCGKLVVSSDVADAGEVLEPFAFIYKDDNPKALAECIDRAIRVVRDPEEISGYSGKIREFVEDNSLDRVAQKVNSMLYTIAAKQKGNRML